MIKKDIIDYEVETFMDMLYELDEVGADISDLDTIADTLEKFLRSR